MKRIPFLAGFGFLMVLYGILPVVLHAESADMESLIEMPLDQLVQVKVASNIVSDIEKQPVFITVISDRQIRLSGSGTLNTAFQKAHTSGYMYGAAVDYDGQRLVKRVSRTVRRHSKNGHSG